MAYKLNLPATSRVQPVFHVSQLKLARASTEYSNTFPLPQVNDQGSFEWIPLRSLDSRTILRNQQLIYQVLIRWKGYGVDEATWEDEDLFKTNFPYFCLHPLGHGASKGEGLSKTQN